MNDLQVQLRDLITRGLTFAEAVQTFVQVQRQTKPELDRYWQAAEQMNCVDEGVCEIDTQSPDDATIVSKGEDGGAYVLAWVWVDDENAVADDPII